MRTLTIGLANRVVSRSADGALGHAAVSDPIVGGNFMIRRILSVMQNSTRADRKYRVILLVFGSTGVALFVLGAVAPLPSPVHSITQSIGEALVVAVVVSLVVEPRLLRYFGEELSSQTFWSSFYSRAPDNYREAIKELAATTDFAHAFNFTISFDWADEEKTVIELMCEWVEHRENRGPKPLPLKINAFVPESHFQGYEARFTSCVVACEELALYEDLMNSGVLKVIQGEDGRLTMVQDESRAPFRQVPPNGRYTKVASAITYFGAMGFMPFMSVGPTLEFKINLCGSALPDLYFSVVHPWKGVEPEFTGPGTDLAAKDGLCVSGVFIEGQSVVLFWKPVKTN